MKRILSIAMAAIMALSVATGALAATSGTVTETLNVPATLSLTLSVPSIDYGTVAKDAASAPREVVATISADVPWKLAGAATALTSGANTIPKSARAVRLDGSTENPWADGNLCTGAGSGSPVNKSFAFRLIVPIDAVPGAYTGSMTFTLSQN